jgi:hypothetical protein
MRPPPIFVGGSGRSGTTIVSRLLGEHSGYAHIPVELRFHCSPGGVPDVLGKRIGHERFVQNMRERFYFRGWQGGGRGVHWVVPGEAYHRATMRFVHGLADDPVAATRQLLLDVFDPYAEAHGKSSWIEMTPGNIHSAPHLARAIPEARFIHAVRDGRDVASSVVPLPWGPSDIFEAIRWWGDQLRAAEEATRDIGAERVLVVRLEDLVVRNRDRTYGQLLEFLGVNDEPGMQRYFEEEVSPERGHIGRWREGAGSAKRQHIQRVYDEVVEALAGEGVTCLP